MHVHAVRASAASLPAALPCSGGDRSFGMSLVCVGCLQRWWLLLWVSLVGADDALSADGDTTTIVNTTLGYLRCGAVGTTTRQCLGVPFAAPPTGSLRWRAPANASSWSGLRDATKRAPLCIQGGHPPVANETDEDCLYLDIYTPKPTLPRPAGGFPVVVWLHGGSYSTGSPQNASMLVELTQNIVWVGVNYRLNVFGFLGADELRSRDDARNGTGNYGLQDQRLAMQWTRQHIANFGGDPNSITINGCSAGAGSTANHVVNPRSWPFFDRAAGESGMLAAWNTNSMMQSQALYNAVLKQSKCMNVDCLVAMNSTDLATAASRAFHADPTAHWGPTIDEVETIDSPYNLTKRGQLFKGPLLIGTARDETCSLEGRDWSFGLDQKGFEADLAEEYGNQTKPGGVNISKMVALYTQPRRPSITRSRRPVSEWWWAAIEQSSDFSFHCPARFLAAAVANVTSHPTLTSPATHDRDWLAAHGENRDEGGGTAFLFSYNVSINMWPHWGGVQCTPHCAELGALFFSSLPDPKTPQGQLIETIARYHTSFARHGDPNVEKAAYAPTWPAFGNTKTGSVDAGMSLVFALPAAGGVRTEAAYRQQQCDYWDTLSNGPD